MIEEVDDLVESLADQAQIWGGCRASATTGCVSTEWCRQCWTMDVKKRMREAVLREESDARNRSDI